MTRMRMSEEACARARTALLFCERPKRNKINDLAAAKLQGVFCKRRKKDMLSWHWINCLLLGLSLVEKLVCYCVKCYLYAYPSVWLLDSLPFLSLTLFLSLFLCRFLCLSYSSYRLSLSFWKFACHVWRAFYMPLS